MVVRRCDELAPVAAAIAGLRLGIFSAKSACVARSSNTAAFTHAGLFDRPISESVIKPIRKKLVKSPAFSLDLAYGLLHIWIIESALGGFLRALYLFNGET